MFAIFRYREENDTGPVVTVTLEREDRFGPMKWYWTVKVPGQYTLERGWGCSEWTAMRKAKRAYFNKVNPKKKKVII